MQNNDLFRKSINTLTQMMGDFLLLARLCPNEKKRLYTELVTMCDLINNILDNYLTEKN